VSIVQNGSETAQAVPLQRVSMMVAIRKLAADLDLDIPFFLLRNSDNVAPYFGTESVHATAEE
jgi:hypothetical protein